MLNPSITHDEIMDIRTSLYGYEYEQYEKLCEDEGVEPLSFTDYCVQAEEDLS